MNTNWWRIISRGIVFAVFVVTGIAIMVSSHYDFPAVQAQLPTTPAPTPTPEPVFDQAAEMAKLREAIKGKETEPAEKVFKNIQTLKGIPAGNLLGIMAGGFSRSLGVSCTHCHTAGKWEADEKTQKQAARDMWVMMGTINRQLLPAIKNLGSATPTINCTTCHRGQIIPALNLPAAKPA